MQPSKTQSINTHEYIGSLRKHAVPVLVLAGGVL